MLDRILTTPQLARAVPQLPPELLHRVIRHCGLEHCGELVARATPDQVARLFDLDLWRAPAPGLDERFDADRFGTWLEVILDAGVQAATDLLSAIDANLLAAGFAEHVRVFDHAAVAPYLTLDGEVVPGRVLTACAVKSAASSSGPGARRSGMPSPASCPRFPKRTAPSSAV